MLNLTETEMDVLMADVRGRGWTLLDREDIRFAGTLTDDPREMIQILGSWNQDYEYERGCDERAAERFEDASY